MRGHGGRKSATREPWVECDGQKRAQGAFIHDRVILVLSIFFVAIYLFICTSMTLKCQYMQLGPLSRASIITGSLRDDKTSIIAHSQS